MAMVATKVPYVSARDTTASTQNVPAALRPSTQSHRRTQPALTAAQATYASPTESEFSDIYDGPDSVRSWDEKRVAEWLHSINCGQYEQLFKANNFNGDNLLECDQAVLKELGIKKIGDRVRIFVAIKGLRNKAYAKQRKRNRDSFAALDNTAYTPSSSGSPRPPQSATQRSLSTSQAFNRRKSTIIDGSMVTHNMPTSVPANLGKLPLRPGSPSYDGEGRSLRTARYNVPSPMDMGKREPGQTAYFPSNPPSASSSSGRRPGTPGDPSIPTRRPAHSHNQSLDGSTMGSLPQNFVRVIYQGGETRVIESRNRKTAEEIIRATLKRFGLREDHVKNYRFWVLGGTDPDPALCRPIGDAELVRICGDRSRAERNRLILRKIHAGEPGEDELQRAAQIATEEYHSSQVAAVQNNTTRSGIKLAQLTGESLDMIQTPLGSSGLQRPPNPRDLEVVSPMDEPQKRPPGVMRQFLGQRPPSELISSDLATYFPEHQKEDIEKTVRMSIRRSMRLSRATSRLSTVSNLSMASSLKDAPPIPSIADTWLTGGSSSSAAPRPLSLTKYGLPPTSYRDSVASSSLEPLREESYSEPDRKSYVSFESGSDSASNLASEGVATNLNPSPATEITKALAEDGEEQDEELTRFLAGESWENTKWMKGALIGQGSFGSVYLALHAITGELMAVKQVEMPSDTGSQVDNKKKSMVEALKREIGLLKELQHPNIVQYLGSSSDDDHLNIFLEYVPGGSVAAMLNQYGPLREPLIRNFVRQTLTGLAYLHGREIIHRDIKGANVLVDNKGGIKISDFGISKRVEASSLLNSGAAGRNRPSLQGSVFWMAPEVVKQTSYTRKADIWSLGCLVVEMFTGTHPYPDSSQLQAIFKIGNSKASPNMPEQASHEAKTFLERTFELDHNKRPSADELLLSPFLNPTA
ncbi:MAG: ATP binding [Thelocarpon superellum]|nr:MAG: ATP binding [Thelocarpon superellum]